MTPLADLQETQPLDGDDDDDSNSQSSEDTVEADHGETLAVETERAMEDSILYGETQAVDGGDGDDEIVAGDWIETQVVGNDEGIEDTEVVGDEGFEDTEVVGDGDDVRVLSDGVDSDAETDDEGNDSKASVRSIASVRAASLRASGLAAARSNISKAVDVESNSSFNNSENYNNQNNGSGGQTSINGMLTLPSSTVDYTVFDNKKCEIVRDHEMENSQKCTQDYYRDESKSRNNNQVVKKLFSEATSAEEENTSKLNDTTGLMDSPGSLIPDNIAGLSYVESQEPGDLSQANALGIVDKFLVINNLGLSQEADIGKSIDIVKSPPVASAKGAQVLAKKTENRSPVGNKEAFEWIDSLEDEGGGEFFTKRKASFFERIDGARKSRSQPPKLQKVVNVGEGANSTNHQKEATLTRSDSRLMRNGSSKNEKMHVAETRTKKNLFKDLTDKSNSKSLDQQLEVTDDDRREEGMHEFGPDTQMAAEAMETLIYGAPINNEMNGAHASAAEVATKRTATKSAFSKTSAFSTPNTVGVSTRSKQRNMLSTHSKKTTKFSSRSNSRGNKNLECSTGKSKLKRGKQKMEQNLNAKTSVPSNYCSGSLEGHKELEKVGGTSKGARKCSNSLMLNDQPSSSKEVTQGQFCVNSIAVAHRTRHSKEVRLSEKTEDIATAYGKGTNVRSRGLIAREDEIVINSGGSHKTKRKHSDTDSVQDTEVERNFMSHTKAHNIQNLHEKEKEADCNIKGALTHPKKRRTRQANQDNPNINDKLPSSFDDIIQPKIRQRNITANTRSISEILDTAKRKRRSTSSHMVSDINSLASDGVKAMFVSGVRARSLKSSSCNPNMEDAKTEESPNKKHQPAKDVDAVSPVCVAQDYPRTPGSKGRTRSLIARELLRLEASKLSPTSIINTRRRKDMANVHVLFSHHLDDDIVKQQKKIMGRLGVSPAFSISDATHFVTDNFVRTRNMLEAMAMGKPVVTHMWLESCGQASCFLDVKNYILRDAKKEREIGFSMPLSLARARQSPLLQDRRVYITPNTKPSSDVISSLVKAAHGQPVERIGRSVMKDDKIPNDLLVLSCDEDYSVCIPLLEKGAEIFSSELLLNGIVTQKLEYDRHRLFLDHVKRTRSTIWLRREDDHQFLPVTKCT
ncbi:uncharacterized protein A4U43_C08F31110 [Asparagus officinalis]|uniref:uncharacterized protein LOC109819704 isoform X2 n=1 Tax=Asparagus officinalis TaxID=4686 RepID=UPI00098E6D2B|nr:uncharacterized protein LOC109819704 isoform X2 [Asparagus officinalis]ONK61548.1 uncharacterized protein A4U43_C08F31110 [Asparagus officinalis]